MGGRASFPVINLPKERIIVITGANKGLGYEIAKWCAMMGATIILACRFEQRAKQAIERMHREFEVEKSKGAPGLTDNLALIFMQVDLASFKSVINFTEEYTQSGRQLHVLFLNAGFGHAPYAKTEDGLESVLQVNYLSHFLMSAKLLPIMQRSGKDCRILLMSSLGHRFCQFDVKTMNYTGLPERFSQPEYYCRSKLYQVMQMYSMVQRLKIRNITLNCIDPGIVKTDYGNERSGYERFKVTLVMLLFGVRIEEGAKSSIDLVVNPKYAGITGQYFVKSEGTDPSSTARNELLQEQLWAETLRLLKDHLNTQDIAVMEGRET